MVRKYEAEKDKGHDAGGLSRCRGWHSNCLEFDSASRASKSDPGGRGGIRGSYRGICGQGRDGRGQLRNQSAAKVVQDIQRRQDRIPGKVRGRIGSPGGDEKGAIREIIAPRMRSGMSPPPGYTREEPPAPGLYCLKVATDALHPYLRERVAPLMSKGCGFPTWGDRQPGSLRGRGPVRLHKGGRAARRQGASS